MSTIAIAPLQTPWDCKWSRFGRVHASADAPAEGLWVCLHDGTRRSIHPLACETCAHFEYESPFFRPSEQRVTTTIAQERVTACARLNRTEKRLEIGVRVVALALAAVFAGTGFVLLTRPLAIPLTISLWLCAAPCFLLGIWGNFNRKAMPDRSW